jgi:hypothetical protein
LGDPSYMEGLPKGHALKARENVFAFSMDSASKQVLQMLALTLAPLGQPNPGAQLITLSATSAKSPLTENVIPNASSR